MPVKSISVKNIYEVLSYIRKRPSFVDSNITHLWYYLEGYHFSSITKNTDSYEVFPQFWYFHEFVKEHYNRNESTAGWKNIILRENDGDNEKSFSVFFELLEEFKKLYVESIKVAQLSEENIKFHHSDECEFKRGDNLPIWNEPKEVYLIEYSNSFGWSLIIKPSENFPNEWSTRYSSEEEAKDKVKGYFGDYLQWEACRGNLNELATSLY
ncbi:hypothetical protein K6119_10715 [Paracrocinitomix mangrovi]|uniref:hypothetical protein n=1 Tax=Paracrocinitomix mangrovi TaxID=2862509 RepID=UPI001C8DE348|nr:hypothetical protein [Paracrocinitomix mangrovi]UKN00204.1 hypothetical protein K6119_10715 [Paracrocinitomix mangrovi]